MWDNECGHLPSIALVPMSHCAQIATRWQLLQLPQPMGDQFQCTAPRGNGDRLGIGDGSRMMGDAEEDEESGKIIKDPLEDNRNCERNPKEKQKLAMAVVA